MVGGFLTVLSLWFLGYHGMGKTGLTGPAGERFAPFCPFGLDPLIYGLLVSFALGILGSWFTQPLPDKHVDRYFLANERSP